MSGDLADLGFNVNTSGLRRGQTAMASYSASGRRMETQVSGSVRGIGSSFSSLTKLMVPLAAGFSAIAAFNKTLTVSREFDVLNSQLITATGSAENAALAFTALESFGATTPYNLSQAVEGFTKLVNLGLTPSEAALVSYGNTASAMGKDLSQMIEAVADATTGEFERLKEFGIKAKSEGDNVSFTFQGVTTKIGKNASEIERYLMNIGDVNFAGAMDVRAQTLDGTISNLADTWDGLFRTISNAGVGEAIKQAATVATTAIQTLDDLINSGALSTGLNALFAKFGGYVSDVKSAFTVMSAIVYEEFGSWQAPANQFFDNMLEGLSKLPEMTRFFIQLSAVNLAKFVDYAEIYGSAFSDIISSKFDHVMARAEIVSQAIRDALNPFSDDSNTTVLLSSVDMQFETATARIISSANERAEAASAVADSVILSFAREGDQATKSYNDQITKSKELLAQYEKEKSAKNGDILSQFKIGGGNDESKSPASTTGLTSSSSVDGLQSVIDDITSTTKIGQLQELNNELELTQDLLDMGALDEDIGTQRIQDLHDAIKDLNEEEPGDTLTSQFDQATDAISGSLTAMRELTEQGTSGYYKLSTAMAVVEAAQAAMAIAAAATTATITGGISAAVSLIAAISTLGGDLDTTFEATQAVQGLEEWGEKADSISAAVEDTADATEDLVGINTDMLDALVNLQSDLLSASGIAQQDISSTDVSTTADIGSFFDNMSNLYGNDLVTGALSALTFGASDFILSLTGGVFDVLGSLLGGSSKTTDSGIQIIGGSIADLIDDAYVYAYETVKSKKYAWSSSSSKTFTSELEDASTQFSLVFESLADSVYESGIALGFSSEYLTDAINSFVVDTSKISLKGLDSDEITDEIESYFSNVFSDIAESVVYYLADFQDTGEELSETLTRISTEVSLLNYAADNLGVTISSLAGDSEALVTAADNITDMLGGTDEFSDALSSFIGAFASDADLLTLYSDSLTEALEDVGLTLPTTSTGMWDLIGTLDASTTAGQEQIATILSLTEVSEEYYDLLSDTEEEMADLSDTFASAVADIYDISDATTQMSLDAALAAAKLGDFSLAEALDTSDYTLDTADFTSLADYNVAQAEAANKLIQLSELAASEAGDVETEQLDELKAINASIIASITETNTLLRSQNRTAIDTSDYLDQINNKTSYAA